MTLKNYVEKSSYRGSVKELMTTGLAVEFIQPWYVPLPTTPQNTGIALGGIGSTFTMTPAGTTPVLNILPGIQVRGENNSDVRLAHFFYSEREACTEFKPRFMPFIQFSMFNGYYTLTDAQGGALLDPEALGEEATLAKIQEIVLDKDLYEWNKEALIRWNIELSQKTKRMIAEGNTACPEFNRILLLDFFNGTLVDGDVHSMSLTCDWDEKEICGQSAYPSEKAIFSALYPVAQTEYKDTQKLDISKQQYSLIVAGDEKLCSLPVSFTKFIISNPTEQVVEFNLVQSQENLCGFHAIKERSGSQDASFVLARTAHFQKNKARKVKLSNGQQIQMVHFSASERSRQSDFYGSMAIGVKMDPTLTVSAKPSFYTNTENGVIASALHSGTTNQLFAKGIYSNREIMLGALCVNGCLQPGESKEVLFSTIFDFAEIDLPGMESEKKYTAYFPERDKRSSRMMKFAYEAEEGFVEQLHEASKSILNEAKVDAFYGEDTDAAKHFKTMSANTLSFISEATVWDVEDRFLVRECADYPFFNSLDVYFYGSFSLLKLLPRLDGQVMRRFADAVLAENLTVRRHFDYVGHPSADLPRAKLEGPRAVKGAVIHDLGSPFDAKPDAYDWHNVKEWKDLAPKFILMVLRHYNLTGDKSIVEDCWQAVDAAMNYLHNMVEEGQQFPLTRGTDDTFDNLSSHGISVYCGSLWIAGLRAHAQIMSILGKDGSKYENLADSANLEFEQALWDEEEGYYHFFVTPFSVNDVADENVDALANAVHAIGIKASTNKVELVQAINRWLNITDLDDAAHAFLAKANIEATAFECSKKRAVRQTKKRILEGIAHEFLQDSWAKKVDLDSDEVFADQMLADAYCRMLNLAEVCTDNKKIRALTKVYEIAYKGNSATLGAANMVRRDGSPMEWDNFQAHDVWIGVQHSIATAMVQVGLDEKAKDIIASMYRNLYQEAKIPFAAPEGFNGTCRLTVEELAKVNADNAQAVITELSETGALQIDGRIAPDLTRSLAEFSIKYAKAVALSGVDAERLFKIIHATALKYTAGKYFRPGMIFAIL